MTALASLLLGLCLTLAGCGPSSDAGARVLKVALIPADGGTESGTRADFAPVFDAMGRHTGLTFELTVAQSYGAVVEALCSGQTDIAFVGPVTYVQAQRRGCTDFLAVAVDRGQSVYYSALVVRAASPIRQVADLRGKRVGFGDSNSTSSFIVPIDMIRKAGIDPTRDLARVALIGSHASSLAALISGQVDVAALSLDSLDKALASKVVKASDIRVIARSQPIPYPPFVMRRSLDDATKQTLRVAFDGIAHMPGIDPALIRGYGGKPVDDYRSDFDPLAYDAVAEMVDGVTPDMRDEILAAASRR